MATGTTADAVMKRNRIVELAIRACRGVKPGQAVDNNMMRDGVALLNEILREEDNDMTGTMRSLWALAENYVMLAANRWVYGTTEGLAADVQDVDSVMYRDAGGEDVPLKLISQSAYDNLSPKDQTGDPECVLLVENRVLSSQVIRPWPVPGSVTTASVVEGSDTQQYTCIKKHTSSTETKPITGSSYRLFWRQTGSGGSAWATDTEYVNTELIKLSYKRPLYDFDLADDDPDLPLGWGNYLKWRLVLELAPMFKIPLEERAYFGTMLKSAYAKLFPQTRNKSTDYHNKAKYF